MKHVFVLAAAALGMAACTAPDLVTGTPSSDTPLLTIADATTSSGRAGFYFLPPAVSAPTTTGTFDATLAPRVRIVCLSAVEGPCPVVFASAPSGPESVKLDVGDESYGVNWKTPDDLTLGVGAYRQEVWLDPDGAAGPLADIRLGYADLHVVAKTQDLKAVDESRYVGLVRGKPHKVRFRIETSAISSVVVTPAAGAEVSVGGAAIYTAIVRDLHGNLVQGAPVTWSVVAPGIASASPTLGNTNAAGSTVSTITGMAVGSATVGATSRGVSGAAPITVVNPVVGRSAVPILQVDACNRPDGRSCESLVGNTVTDAMRLTYGTDFAIFNSGGLRANLTCPVIDNPADNCPAFAPPPHLITRGQVNAVLPFGNRVTLVQVSGAELKVLLENAVSTMPAADGRFAQVSGLCFTYDVAAAGGARVTGAVRQGPTGNCTDTPVGLTAASTYTIAQNDFMAAGGDGYTDFTGRFTVQGLVDQVLADWLSASGTIYPIFEGRIRCTTSGAAVCPTIVTPDLTEVVGTSAIPIPRADACGQSDGRRCESMIGNTVTDAMRLVHGTDFAITNAGGLRANLTCPAVDIPGDFCPPFTPGLYPITRGQVLGVLPFGNRVALVQVSGAELKVLLENAVSIMPLANGRFAQVSGLCFSYDISAPAGSRLTNAVQQAAGGSCTGAPLNLTAGASYSLAMNDFMAVGGDGYTDFTGRFSLAGRMDQVVAGWLPASSPINPTIQGRISCTTSGATPCPVISP
jgi:2',3'-cyclic-nucleotide 2'-phosphodiesterase (5'-nucleotidase family)